MRQVTVAQITRQEEEDNSTPKDLVKSARTLEKTRTLLVQADELQEQVLDLEARLLQEEIKVLACLVLAAPKPEERMPCTVPGINVSAACARTSTHPIVFEAAAQPCPFVIEHRQEASWRCQTTGCAEAGGQGDHHGPGATGCISASCWASGAASNATITEKGFAALPLSVPADIVLANSQAVSSNSQPSCSTTSSKQL